MEIVSRSISALTAYENNSRTHPEAQIAQIAASIKEFGFTNPVLIDKTDGVIAGHGRLLAAKALGHTEVPCIVLAGLSDVQKRAYVIADNKLALNGGWDDKLLAIEFSELSDACFDTLLTGFTQDEIDALNVGDVDALDEMPELRDGDREPFQQKAFTLHDEQVAIVDDAITLARTHPLVDTGLNENSNGNALALICAAWLKSNG